MEIRHKGLLLALIAIPFAASAASAQRGPDWQSICDMPRSTPHWNEYCGGGDSSDSGRQGCDAQCRAEERAEQEQRQQIDDGFKDIRKRDDQQRAARELIGTANTYAHDAQNARIRGHSAKALGYYNKALALADWPEWRMSRGCILRDLNHYDEAMADFQHVIDVTKAADPGGRDPAAIGVLSAAEVEMKDTLAELGRHCARKDCSTGGIPNERLTPETIHEAEAFAGQGFAEIQSGNYDRALWYYDQALNLLEYPQWRLQRAWAMRNLHRGEVAMNDYVRIIRTSVRYWNTHSDPQERKRAQDWIDTASELMRQTLGEIGRPCQGDECLTWGKEPWQILGIGGSTSVDEVVIGGKG